MYRTVIEPVIVGGYVRWKPILLQHNTVKEEFQLQVSPVNARFFLENKLEELTAYKVLAKCWNGFYSTNIHNRVRYNIGEVTKPDFGKLFVFKDLQLARAWSGESYPIFKCYVSNPQRAEYMAASQDEVRIFWKGDKLTHGKEPPPYGTYFVDEVQLIEKVQ